MDVRRGRWTLISRAVSSMRNSATVEDWQALQVSYPVRSTPGWKEPVEDYLSRATLNGVISHKEKALFMLMLSVGTISYEP